MELNTYYSSSLHWWWVLELQSGNITIMIGVSYSLGILCTCNDNINYYQSRVIHSQGHSCSVSELNNDVSVVDYRLIMLWVCFTSRAISWGLGNFGKSTP